MRSPLLVSGYTPQFSGHETFPLRYGWLKKVYDRVAETEDNLLSNRAACWDDDAIARFGVGKNMVAAMRHWAKVAQIITEPPGNTVRTEQLGTILFSEAGLDPYMENPATLWLVHWQLAARAVKTTWFWAFSHYPAITFDRDRFQQLLDRFIRDRGGWPTVAAKTLQNDIACFLRTYVARHPSGKAGPDDALESPLTELGLVRAVSKDSYRFVYGPKSTLGGGVFSYALVDFWRRYAPDTATLSFEAIARAPGSPGRVFLLDENDTVDRLATLDKVTKGKLRWTETAGLKQVERSIPLDEDTRLNWLLTDYNAMPTREEAA